MRPHGAEPERAEGGQDARRQAQLDERIGNGAGLANSPIVGIGCKWAITTGWDVVGGDGVASECNQDAEISMDYSSLDDSEAGLDAWLHGPGGRGRLPEGVLDTVSTFKRTVEQVRGSLAYTGRIGNACRKKSRPPAGDPP